MAGVSIAAPIDQPKENEYYDAVVLLIDHEKGLLGVSILNEVTNKDEKLSFKVDPDTVYVSNSLNQYLEFADIQVGDHLDIYSVVGADGTEEVTDILDGSRFEEQ